MKTLPFAFITLFIVPNFVHSQTESPFVAHEWGTFTTLQNSNGKLLSGLQRDEERLPYFVNNICFCWTDFQDKGYATRFAQLSNVTVKMETPVIYFYSEEEREVLVDVEFKQGSISQWYPRRSSGEPNPTQGYNGSQGVNLDFSESKTGWIKWDAIVLAPDDTSKISSNPESETEQWVRPRATESNLIKVKSPDPDYPQFDQIEKFLFYRGIANFEVPVKVEFNNSGSLVITNNFSEQLKYVLVYEKNSGQPANVWWSGMLNSEKVKVIPKPEYKLSETEVLAEMTGFENALVNAGLYRDEAAAMLNTWKESYFEHEGLKVFWIAPRYFTDEILPIAINPQPDELERVIVGRSEVLTPEFEQNIMQYSDSSFTANLYSDWFFLAYSQLRKEGIPTQWNSFDQETIIDRDTISETQSILVYPNPAQSELFLSSHFNDPEKLLVRIFNSAGSEAYRSDEKVDQGEFNLAIDVSNYPPGIYLLMVQSEDFQLSRKVIKTN